MKFITNILNKSFNIVFNSIETNIRENLFQKNIPPNIVDFIIYKAIKYNNLYELNVYLNNPTITYQDLINENDLFKLFEKSKLKKPFISSLINISGTSKTITFGKGEIALSLFINDAVKHNHRGDLLINNLILEIKHSKSQISESKYSKRTSKLDIFDNEKLKPFITKYNPNLSQKTTWIKSIFNCNPTKEDFISLFQTLYPGLDIEYDFTSLNNLNNSIGLALAKTYLDKKILLIIDKNNKYICVKNYDEFKSLLDTKIKFNLASDLIPRCELTF